MYKYVMVALFSGFLSCISQLLLKKASLIHRNNWLKEYVNIYVILGYIIMAVCMGLTILSFKGLPYKYGAVLETLVYLYIMILSRIFFKEKLTFNRIIGNVLIVCGVIIFSLGQ